MFIPKHPQFSISENQIEYVYRGTSTEDLQRQFYQDKKEIQEAINSAFKLNIPHKMTLFDTMNMNRLPIVISVRNHTNLLILKE